MARKIASHNPVAVRNAKQAVIRGLDLALSEGLDLEKRLASQLSLVKGREAEREMNTMDFLSIANAICPERDSIVFDSNRWTYGQINERINRLTHALVKSGIKNGDRIGILQVNCNQYIESYFAAAKLGAIFVPLNFRAKADELAYMIGHAEIRTLFVGNRYREMINGMLPQLPSVKECIPIDPGSGPSYEDLIHSSSSDEFMGEIGDEDITILMYTSGTTGRPKGVPLRHSAFVTYVLDNVEPANPDIEEKNLLTVPLNHVAGIQAMLAAIYGGRTLVLMRQFEVKEWLGTIQREQVTRAMLVPTMLKRVIDDSEFSQYNLSSLKVITYGAAPMPFEVIRKAIQVLPVGEIHQCLWPDGDGFNHHDLRTGRPSD